MALDGRLSAYVRTLRGFGLTEAEIAAYHDIAEQAAGVDRRAALAAAIDDHDAASLTDRLHRTLARSQHGIDAPREYWSHAPQVHLQEVLDPYGCEVRLRDETGSPLSRGTDDGEIHVAVRTPATGEVRRTTFRYPDHPLGTDNYPALVAAVEEDILAATPLTVVLLADRTRGWQFVLLERERLDRLRDRFGERVAPFGEPLLHADQPAAFLTSPGGPTREEAAFMATVDEGLENQWRSVRTTTAVDTDAILDRYGITDPAAVADSREGRHEVPAAERAQDVAADAEDLAAVTEALADVSLDASDPEDAGATPPPAERSDDPGDDLAVSAGDAEFEVAGAAVEGDLDEVFAAIERDVAGETAGASAGNRTTAATGADAIEELVDAMPALSDAERDSETVTADDVAAAAAGGRSEDAMTAFERVRRELHTETAFEWVGEDDLAAEDGGDSGHEESPRVADGGCVADDD